MGISCEFKTNAETKWGLPRGGLRAVLLYLALWGWLCSMAALSDAGVLPLTLGGALALLPPLLLRKDRAALRFAALAAVAAVLLLTRRDALDGVRLLLNRLFAASEARQTYTYEKFIVPAAAGVPEMQAALLPLGLLIGLLCGLSARFRLRLVPTLLFALCALAAAWLGVSPGAGWYVLSAAALALGFADGQGPYSAAAARSAAVLSALLLICAAVFALFPGEDARLSAWDETMRDRLAMETVAYTDAAPSAAPQTVPAAQETKQFYRAEETAADTDGDEETLSLPLPLLLAILLTALLLFVPAVWSDRLKKRRAAHRAGLDDPDPGAAIRAAFLYAMRWLDAGGLRPGNRPYGDCAPEIGAAFTPELRAEFEQVLPIWREAAYSAHPMDGAQRDAMLRFMEHARSAAWDRLGRRDRLRIKYLEAL